MHYFITVFSFFILFNFMFLGQKSFLKHNCQENSNHKKINRELNGLAHKKRRSYFSFCRTNIKFSPKGNIDNE